MAAKRQKRPAAADPGPPPRHAPKAAGHTPWPLVGAVGRGLLALGVVVGVMLVVVWVGGRAGVEVAPNPRYGVPFADIHCPTPPGVDRQRFLTEVRFLGDLPDTIQVVDPALKDRLAAVFARHPWVAVVGPVEVKPDATITVGLTFRVPVVAVAVLGEPDARLVDRAGVLLPGPLSTPVTVPLFQSPQPPPKQQPGEVWDNPDVKRAADLAVTYHPRRLEKTRLGWKVERTDGKVQTVLW